MSLKRKAKSAVQRATKAGRASNASTPGSSTPRNFDSDDSRELSDTPYEPNKVIAQSIQKFDISCFPYALRPNMKDTTSGYFQPQQRRDFTALPLKPDHHNRPLWINGWGKLTLESFHPLAPRVQDFLITIAEPTSRRAFLHEYKLTTHSLYAAASVGLSPKDIVNTLNRFLKNRMPPNVIEHITHCGRSYGEVEGQDKRQPRQDQTRRDLTIDAVYPTLSEEDEGDEQDIIYAFQIKDETVGIVAQRCLALHFPALEEYDFRNDNINANLEINLRVEAQIRPYQEQSLSKMFGNGRAMSGIIVLPCGAGKTLVGVTAACTIKKGVVVLATSNIIAIFSSDNKTVFTGNTGIIITTYSMVTNARDRAHESAKMMNFLQSREWGLMILDEVHVVPAQMFRRVIGSIKSHSKLGLTATLVREDNKIEDLNFLIGPKLYEANWMEPSQQGYIAKVQCAEVWCHMSSEFYEQYLQSSVRNRLLFCAINPSKFQACQYLINYHENRGDKIIVFSDNVYALEVYAKKTMKPYLYGGTGNAERQKILHYFRNSPQCNTLFLSKIGDTSLGLPEATCLIQISAQYGSRRQEAQRLGRILRAKRRNEEGFNAFFYSLVSKDTVEMVFSSKRRAFLIDQGYAFKVITHLKNIENTPDLAFATPRARRELLQKVLVELESKSWEREEEKESAGLLGDGHMFYGPDDKPLRKLAEKRGATAAIRTAGTLKDFSGGQDMAYVEQNKSMNKSAKGRKIEHNDFFKSIMRENERRRKWFGGHD